MSEVAVARGATKWYGEVLGLNGFSATFGPGITGLVGPNGAGKTTLFRVLVGQLRLDAGDATVLGRPAWNTPAKNRDVGYCPEHHHLYGWMSAEEFVRSLLQLDGFPREEAEKRALRALREVDLMEARGRKLRTFSRGMRQRVKLAQALAHDPKLVILDEPLSGTDPVGRVKIIELLRRIAAEGRHVIVSSHVLYEVERLTNAIVLMTNGRAIAQGDLHRIRDLIDEHPHTVELETPEPRKLAQALARWDDVMVVDLSAPDRVTIRTRAPDRFYEALPRFVAETRLPITGVRSPDDSLEAVFRYLVR